MNAREEWTSLSLRTQNDSEKETLIQVTNPDLPIPEGLDVIPDFLAASDAQQILADMDAEEDFTWEGFEQRRKVKRYENLENSLPDSLVRLCQQFQAVTGKSPTRLSVEIFPKSQLLTKVNATKSTVSRFETTESCQDINSDGYFVAQIPISAPLVEFSNKPKARKQDCWAFETKDHWTDLLLEQNCLYLKTGDYLNTWRHRIASLPPNDIFDTEAIQEFVTVKLSNIPLELTSDGSPSSTNNNGVASSSEFGYLHNSERESYHVGPDEETPPIQDLLEIIVTTSPIKSNPSTELVEKIFETFLEGGQDFAIQCHKIIVCDGFRQRDENTTQKHSNVKQAMRNGIVDSDQAENYVQYKAALRKLCKDAEPTSPFNNAQVVELESRHGYGFALKHVLEHCVTKPYVIVIQHDRTLMRPTPIAEVVNAMVRHPNIKYVGMSMRSNLLYRDIFLSKYGRQFMDDMKDCTLRLPELALDASIYGPDRTGNVGDPNDAKLQKSLDGLAENYFRTHQFNEHKEWVKHNACDEADGKEHKLKLSQLTLYPVFFWYDNIHICDTKHYRDFIFNPKYKMVKRGGFVEDKVSPVIRKTVERFGLVEGHSRFGCYLLDDASGYFFTGHYDGGAYVIEEDRADMIQDSSKK